jgi:hypothetical protein
LHYLIVRRGSQPCYATGQPKDCGLKGRGTIPSPFYGQSPAQAPMFDWLFRKAPGLVGNAFEENTSAGEHFQGGRYCNSHSAPVGRMKRNRHAHVSNIVHLMSGAASLVATTECRIHCLQQEQCWWQQQLQGPFLT